MTINYQIRQCENPSCGLRYPLVDGNPFGFRCPVCLGPTIPVGNYSLTSENLNRNVIPGIKIEALLDNVRSGWNVGAIFRTADCIGVQKIHLCGITPTPPNKSLEKTALGADLHIPWTYSKNALEISRELIKSGAHLWGLELDDRSVPINSDLTYDGNSIVLIVGNEVTGIDPDLLDLCEKILYIPMAGMKRSLNVEVAFGIGASALMTALNKKPF